MGREFLTMKIKLNNMMDTLKAEYQTEKEPHFFKIKIKNLNEKMKWDLLIILEFYIMRKY